MSNMKKKSVKSVVSKVSKSVIFFRTFVFRTFGLKFGGLAQLARALALQAKGHRFDSDILHKSMCVLRGNWQTVLKI